MTLIQDLGLVEAVLGDVVAFAGGQPVSATLEGYDVALQVLPSGPVAPYITLSGSILSIIGVVLTEYVAFSSGAPVSLAIKEGNTWYGLTLSKPALAVAPASLTLASAAEHASVT